MELSVFDPPAGGQTEGRVQPVYGWYCIKPWFIPLPIREVRALWDNTRFSISIDYLMCWRKNGEKRDWSKLTYTIYTRWPRPCREDET